MHTAFVITEHTYPIYRALAVALGLQTIFDLKEIEGQVLAIDPNHEWSWWPSEVFEVKFRFLDRTDVSLWFAELAE